MIIQLKSVEQKIYYNNLKEKTGQSLGHILHIMIIDCN